MMIRHDRLNTPTAGPSRQNSPGNGRRSPKPGSTVSTAGSLPEQLQAQGKELLNQATRLVTRYPEWSLLAAVSTGLVVGYLLKRR